MLDHNGVRPVEFQLGDARPPPFSGIPDHSSSGLALLWRLVVLRLTFASMRRSFEARVGRVAMRGRGTNVARRTSSARRSRASSRFCACVRKRSARMTSTRFFVSQRSQR